MSQDHLSPEAAAKVERDLADLENLDMYRRLNRAQGEALIHIASVLPEPYAGTGDPRDLAKEVERQLKKHRPSEAVLQVPALPVNEEDQRTVDRLLAASDAKRRTRPLPRSERALASAVDTCPECGTEMVAASFLELWAELAALRKVAEAADRYADRKSTENWERVSAALRTLADATGWPPRSATPCAAGDRKTPKAVPGTNETKPAGDVSAEDGAKGQVHPARPVDRDESGGETLVTGGERPALSTDAPDSSPTAPEPFRVDLDQAIALADAMIRNGGVDRLDVEKLIEDTSQASAVIRSLVEEARRLRTTHPKPEGGHRT